MVPWADGGFKRSPHEQAVPAIKMALRKGMPRIRANHRAMRWNTATFWSCLLCGVLISAPFHLPSLWFSPIVGLSLFFWLVEDASDLKAALYIGALSSLWVMVGLFYWLLYPIHVYG